MVIWLFLLAQYYAFVLSIQYIYRTKCTGLAGKTSTRGLNSAKRAVSKTKDGRDSQLTFFRNLRQNYSITWPKHWDIAKLRILTKRHYLFF